MATNPMNCQLHIVSIYIIEAGIYINIFIICFHLLFYAKEEIIKHIDFNFRC